MRCFQTKPSGSIKYENSTICLVLWNHFLSPLAQSLPSSHPPASKLKLDYSDRFEFVVFLAENLIVHCWYSKQITSQDCKDSLKKKKQGLAILQNFI